MGTDLITVHFPKWEDWNPRKDIKHPTWFAMSNRITEDDQVQELSDVEFRAFVHLFCLASQQKGHTAEVNLSKAERVTGIMKHVFLETIQMLSAFGICTQGVRGPSDDVRDTTENVREPSATIHNKTRHNRVAVRMDFDFEMIFALYPKRPNTDKSAGIASLRRQVLTPDDFKECLHAAENYANYVKTQGIEPKFIKQFKTWCGSKEKPNWREWIAVDAPRDPDLVTR